MNRDRITFTTASKTWTAEAQPLPLQIEERAMRVRVPLTATADGLAVAVLDAEAKVWRDYGYVKPGLALGMWTGIVTAFEYDGRDAMAVVTVTPV